jgi:hypothetical protein
MHVERTRWNALWPFRQSLPAEIEQLAAALSG